MRSRRLFCVLALVCVVGRAGFGRALEAQAPSGSPSAVVDEETRKQIRELKLKAIEATNAGDLKKELELQQKILKLDPDDARALNRSTEIPQIIEKQKARTIEDQLKSTDEQARQVRAQEEIQRIEDALIEARRTGAPEPLDRAQQALADARKYARSGDPKLETLQALIDQERASRRARLIELWGLVGLVTLAAVVAAVLYFVRGGRALEVIDGPQIGSRFALQKQASAIGALASEVDWALEDPLRKISRHHCDVIREGRHYFLVDSSMNGTFLNGQPMQKGQPALLKRGDQINLGGAITLRFR